MTPLDLVALALATLYFAYALTKTHGPFGVFTWIREHAPLGGLTNCIICASVWTSAAFYLLTLTPLAPLVWICAAAGGAVALAHYVGMAQQ